MGLRNLLKLAYSLQRTTLLVSAPHTLYLLGEKFCKCYWTKSVDFVVLIYHIFPFLGADLLITKRTIKSLTVAVDFSMCFYLGNHFCPVYV